MLCGGDPDERGWGADQRRMPRLRALCGSLPARSHPPDDRRQRLFAKTDYTDHKPGGCYQKRAGAALGIEKYRRRMTVHEVLSGRRVQDFFFCPVGLFEDFGDFGFHFGGGAGGVGDKFDQVTGVLDQVPDAGDVM